MSKKTPGQKAEKKTGAKEPVALTDDELDTAHGAASFRQDGGPLPTRAFSLVWVSDEPVD